MSKEFSCWRRETTSARLTWFDYLAASGSRRRIPGQCIRNWDTVCSLIMSLLHYNDLNCWGYCGGGPSITNTSSLLPSSPLIKALDFRSVGNHLENWNHYRPYHVVSRRVVDVAACLSSSSSMNTSFVGAMGMPMVYYYKQCLLYLGPLSPAELFLTAGATNFTIFHKCRINFGQKQFSVLEKLP